MIPRFNWAIIHRERLAALGVGLAILVAGCGGAQATAMPTAMPMPTPTTAQSAAVLNATPVATTKVNIQNFAFSPAVITVPVGATVTWTNDDIEQHTVTARDTSYSSDAIANHQTYSVTYSKVGTYEYFCEIHPTMVGKIVVTAG
ncbi:MAG TPA: cupredoxin family copper-binding protein [Chloroflexota bacterium]|nr:cupredoxin family copper-binding protein [Chloroflexota bacterium]